MTISERMFQIMKEKGVTQSRLSKMTGISTRTICAWHKLGTNPGADKIMVICEALEITPEMLLIGKGIKSDRNAECASEVEDPVFEQQLIEDCRSLSETQKHRLTAYISMLQNMKE